MLVSFSRPRAVKVAVFCTRSMFPEAAVHVNRTVISLARHAAENASADEYRTDENVHRASGES